MTEQAVEAAHAALYEVGDRVIHDTTSLCKTCKNAVPASVIAAADGTVWMRKTCSTHGVQTIEIERDAQWYEAIRSVRPIESAPTTNVKPMDLGCPFDCGPCEEHRQKVRLPVVTITSACNLECPICYVHNKNDDPFHMSTAEFGQILDRLVDENGADVDLINLTGGDPTLHPQLFEFIAMCHARGIHRVSVCTNGIAIARSETFTRQLAEAGARVALSFDSFEADADYAMQGAKLVSLKHRCFDLLEQYDVPTTLIPVMTKGLNDHEIGKMIDLLVTRPNMRHLEVHLITYTGQGGISFDRSGRISMLEVLRRIDETTGGFLTPDDFVPSPCAHPLCYQIAYLLIDPAGGAPVPFSHFLSAQTVYECLGEHLYMEPSPRLERAFIDAIDRLWVEGGDENERILAVLKNLLSEMFPARPLSRAAALAVSERWIKAVYVHAHMDEETFDSERVAQCCDSNCYSDGRTIPVCNSNVLFRDKEPRFMTTPLQWNERAGGRYDFSILDREAGWLTPAFGTRGNLE